MFERNDDVLYVCYDNEAYMNTGVQRSGATPPAARTATTQAVGPNPGNVFGQGKDVPRIAMAHEIPYVATATVADLHDLERKVCRAMTMHGARYIHVFVPCPLGWGTKSSHTVRLARLATQSGLFPVFEAVDGEVTGVTPIRRQVPVEDYLVLQRRYTHLFRPRKDETTIARIQAIADRNIRRYGLLGAEDLAPVLPDGATGAAHKYDDTKCTTPHVDDKTIEATFIKAVNILIAEKDTVKADFEAIKDILFSTEDLER